MFVWMTMVCYNQDLMLKGQYWTFLQYILTSLNTSGYNVAVNTFIDHIRKSFSTTYKLLLKALKVPVVYS